MRFIAAALIALPGFAFAAGGGDSSPPTPTPTTTTCTGSLVWNPATRTCTPPKQSSLSDEQRYDAVRELAYAGRLDDAQAVLATMSDQSEDRVLTYWGFTHGKMGNLDEGMRFYKAALVQNPDNILARSYMGQALIAAGDRSAAEDQLIEIVSRGGQDTWAATSLASALETGKGYSY